MERVADVVQHDGVFRRLRQRRNRPQQQRQTRRAAKMVCLDMDHPEIVDFINWKVREEKKAQAGFPIEVREFDPRLALDVVVVEASGVAEPAALAKILDILNKAAVIHHKAPEVA